VSLAVAIAIAYQVPAIHVRFFDQQGISPRETLWEANIRFFKDRPLTGVGLKHNEELSGYYLMDKFKTSDVFQGHAHNNVIDILGSTGAIGFLFFLAWWGFLFWILTALVRTPPGISPFFAKGLLAAFVVYQINGLTQVNFWEAKVQHQLMWMVAWVLLWSEGRVRE
jgi:O-antigen ligase